MSGLCTKLVMRILLLLALLIVAASASLRANDAPPALICNGRPCVDLMPKKENQGAKVDACRDTLRLVHSPQSPTLTLTRCAQGTSTTSSSTRTASRASRKRKSALRLVTLSVPSWPTADLATAGRAKRRYSQGKGEARSCWC